MIAKVKKVIKDAYGFNASIKKNTVNTNQDMEKLLFVEIIKILQELDERSEVLSSLGLDLTEYEGMYYDLIQNLLKLHFTDGQIEIINYFVYQLPLQDSFEGRLELKKGRKTVEYDFRTPEDLWVVIQQIK